MSAFEEKEYTKKFDLSLWKKIIKSVIPYKKLASVLALAMMVTAVVDTMWPMLTKWSIDTYIVPKTTNGLYKFIIASAFIVVLQSVSIWLFIRLAGKLEVWLMYDIRKKAFSHLQKLSLNYYDKTPVGWLMARITSDSRRLGQVISWGIVDMVWAFLLLIGISTMMLWLNYKLALIVMLVVPPLAILSVYFQNMILKFHRKVRKINSKITGAFNEGIMGACTTKTLNREEQNLDEFKSLTGNMYNSSVKTAVISSLYMPLVLALGSIGTALALWKGGTNVMQGTLSYGTLMAFISYTVQFFEPIRNIAHKLTEMQAAQASAERIFSLLDEKPKVVDSDEIIEKYGCAFEPKHENWKRIEGSIEFNNVDFKYDTGEQVLANFNLKIDAGQTVALVGATGSGKSTLVNLACRFYEPVKGQILIDGIDYKLRSQLWLHSQLGYVLQAPHLFSGTIRDNIAYGKTGCTTEEILKASKLVNAHNFISKLKNGYDTQVGEGGAGLSTGQKQLISLARALVANPAIFVLDEATSSVDTETESLIQLAINNVLSGRTSFIVAHRLSTIKAANRILVLEKGKIIEDGTHSQLLKQKGHYWKLYTNQFMEDQEKLLLAEGGQK